jgi:hypothetical protein
VVNFGPSLNDTWEEIKKFKYTITCSGAHKFLMDHGIVPSFHIDVDPRPHKAALIGQPHKDCEYLMASACHKAVFDLLEGYTVKLWHIFDATDEGIRELPPGEWAVCGGCSAGLRCLTMARFLGFTDLHVFGMDGCEGASGKHAAFHPNQPKDHSELEYPEGSGRIWRTTASMLEAAKQTFHELDMMKDTTVKFYGEGLVQEMAKTYVRKEIKTADLGYVKPELISAEYAELNRKLHASNLAYGVGGGKWADTVKNLYQILQKTQPFVSVLDYGCGRGYLGKALPFPIAEYDPAIPGKTAAPRAADIVVATDVLEHIEPDKLYYVLADLARCTKQIGYFVIYTKPSTKFLADGRNAHLILKGREWWKKKLSKFFTVARIIEQTNVLIVVVGPHQKHRKTLVLEKSKLTEQAVTQ